MNNEQPTYWIGHRGARHTAIMNKCVKLRVAWDADRRMHFTRDKDVAASLRRVGATVTVEGDAG
ncbi:MAG: hypothetical protein E6Q97_12810 [Desulfurellales bacterium]|nr:MAG: hypothetical protein E6Q97_12810 [Desulfurellales bacterium]